MGVAFDGRDLLIEKAGTLARVTHAIKSCRMTHLPDERAPEQALEIERDIRLQASRLAQPRDQVLRHAEAGKLTARENVDVVDRAVAAEERGPFRIDHPCDLGGRKSVAEEGGRRQGMDDVAERTRLDDE